MCTAVGGQPLGIVRIVPDDQTAADDAEAWPLSRRHAATQHAAEQRRLRAAETVRARELIAAFVVAAMSRGLAPAPLRARRYDGRASYRTGTHGWLLHTDGRMAVGTGGEFYLLSVPPSLRGSVFGVTLEASDPPMQIGRSAGDGESISLAELLQRRLDTAPPSSLT